MPNSYYLDDLRAWPGDEVVCKQNILPNHCKVTVGKTYKVVAIDFGSRHITAKGIVDDTGQSVIPAARFQRKQDYVGSTDN